MRNLKEIMFSSVLLTAIILMVIAFTALYVGYEPRKTDIILTVIISVVLSVVFSYKIFKNA